MTDFDINKLVKKLKKDYSTLATASDENETKEQISTGNKALDLATDGGIKFGSCVELSGFSQSGKTTLAQIMLANMQKKYNTTGIWLDRENAFFKDRSEFLGIDTEKTIVFKPTDITTVPRATMALEDVLVSIPKDEYKFIGIDSLAAFDDTTNTEKMDMGKKAQYIHRLFRRILPYIDDKTLFVFCNQRTFMPGVMFGDNKTTVGGEAGKYYTNYRIELDNGKEIKDVLRGNEVIGNWMKAKVIKTRLGPSMRQIIFQHFFKTGIPYLSGYIRLLVDRNVVHPKNKTEFKVFKQSTILYNGNKLQEYDVDKIIEDYPELNFDVYPEYKLDEEIISDSEEEII